MNTIWGSSHAFFTPRRFRGRSETRSCWLQTPSARRKRGCWQTGGGSIGSNARSSVSRAKPSELAQLDCVCQQVGIPRGREERERVCPKGGCGRQAAVTSPLLSVAPHETRLSVLHAVGVISCASEARWDASARLEATVLVRSKQENSRRTFQPMYKRDAGLSHRITLHPILPAARRRHTFSR